MLRATRLVGDALAPCQHGGGVVELGQRGSVGQDGSSRPQPVSPCHREDHGQRAPHAVFRHVTGSLMTRLNKKAESHRILSSARCRPE